MKKIFCIVLPVIICISFFAGCSTVGKDSDTDLNNHTEQFSSTALPDSLKIHRPVSAQETFETLSGMDKKEGCEYIYNQYIYPAERANLLGKVWDNGTLSDKYIFYFHSNAVFHNTEFFRNNFPQGKEKNTVCVPEDIVEDYINNFILNADNILLRSEDFTSCYNEEQKGYDFFVAETSWILDSTQVTDYSLDRDKLVVNYDILPIDEEETIQMSAVFNVEDGLYKLYRTFDIAGSGTSTPSKDGTHSIVTEYSGFRGESSEVHIVDSKTGKSNLLDTFKFSNVSDVGFFSNGDIYIMDYSGLRVFNYSSNMDSKEPLFTTSTNFPAGGVIKEDGTERYIFSIRRNPDKFDYIVVYGEYIEDEDYNTAHINDFQLAYNYRIGILDKNGNLTQSWDTGVPIMFSAFGFENVIIAESGADEILISAVYKNEERFKGRFNLQSETYSSIKEFKAP